MPKPPYKPTPMSFDEFEAWYVRMRFISYNTCAEALNISRSAVSQYMRRAHRPPHTMRMLCRYLERFGTWDQIKDYPREAFEPWRAQLPASKDDIARAARYERMARHAETLRQRRRELATHSIRVLSEDSEDRKEHSDPAS